MSDEFRDEKFAHTEDSLYHYGVKGMRWGYRKTSLVGGGPTSIPMPKKSTASADDVTAFFDSAKFESQAMKSTTSLEEYMAVKLPPVKNPAAELAKNTEKFIAKSDPSGKIAPNEPPDGLTPERKAQLIKIGVGAIAVGAIVGYGAYKVSQNPDLQPKALAFNANVIQSKRNTWDTGIYVKDSSWARSEFELPAGNTFHRISRSSEYDFAQGTYATHNTEDFKRYVAGFRKELGSQVPLKHISWQSTEPIKVPDLKTTLDALKTTMETRDNRTYSPSEVLHKYQNLSGWKWEDDEANDFFNVLKSRGFGAIVDEMDAGVIGETPLVVFANDLMTPKKSAVLTNKNVKDAISNLTDFPKPPRK